VEAADGLDRLAAGVVRPARPLLGDRRPELVGVVRGLVRAASGPGRRPRRSASDIDVSRWFGVTAKSGRVVGLALFANALRGELPRSLGSLSNLRELLLHHNQLVGEIPDSLGGLSQLETLDLSNNRFSGPLPPELAAASRLVYLNVSSNRLSGRLPDALGHLARLEALHLNQNSFTGPVPPSFGSLAKLEVLNASNCWLTGHLPASLAKLTQLRVLFLGHNRLTGTLDVLAPLCARDDPRQTRGRLSELYANDNNLDIDAVHPDLADGLNVLFLDRNRTPLRHHPRDDDLPAAFSTAALRTELSRLDRPNDS